jgi:hypothetical protein
MSAGNLVVTVNLIWVWRPTTLRPADAAHER